VGDSSAGFSTTRGASARIDAAVVASGAPSSSASSRIAVREARPGRPGLLVDLAAQRLRSVAG
jgi:hypothetical protein